MIALDQSLLTRLGLGRLSPVQQQKVLELMTEVLQLRVGNVLASLMTPADHELFDSLMKDENAAVGWLDATFPFYRDTVTNEYIRFISEIQARLAEALERAGPGDGSDQTAAHTDAEDERNQEKRFPE